MKTYIDPVIRSIRKHSVLTELVLVSFAVIAFVFSLMLGLPQGDQANTARATQAQVSVEPPTGTDPAGS